jgi:predicted lysophospholipase L1 biosynthesis ABC-type transport system permease subunit
MSESQNYKNHKRLHPPFHLFVIPVLLLNVLVSIAVLIHHWPRHWALLIWFVVMSLALFTLAGFARGNALRVQDRVIRLEENLRYQRLLPPELATASQSLTLGQIIALRFASDAELPALVQRALSEKLEPKAIKQSITSWRPDDLRV